jgi:Na+/H+ antiporter NhaD/arsenite permease-like protein
MGSALLLGDLPPQMLHSVSGAEFGDFIWQFGRPSSFPILMVTFAITLGAMYAYGFRAIGRRAASVGDVGIEAKIPDPLFATLVVGWFLLTVVGMAFREVLQMKLGFIALTGADIESLCKKATLLAIAEYQSGARDAPFIVSRRDFERVIGECGELVTW